MRKDGLPHIVDLKFGPPRERRADNLRTLFRQVHDARVDGLEHRRHGDGNVDKDAMTLTLAIHNILHAGVTIIGTG